MQLPVHDDLAIYDNPQSNVDYLSHEWKYEELWPTRRHIRKANLDWAYYCRLENALCRAWMKGRDSRQAFPATGIEWDKDSDITWLYGPVKISDQPFGESTILSAFQPHRRPQRSVLKRKPDLWQEHRTAQVTNACSTNEKYYSTATNSESWVYL
ncbi:hypothetical protein ASPWEDRAFT_699595 [Aspergillus wentii DTO 134E9]|uniref:Nitrogen regulatory protein areA GATA-like domain-containing protein n=1 Tax=Aspergillus wentii DTO 134E9 TaxID=1073089 RepID=A0A1L9R598_ASPWE|nr:uncharacterized protein ASPWEDRAFT_699595 [Aspergillus wentii DTO 134E9]OJJ30063.1 hypothetical protein ASPWEDRAFT_699595 [Aspergillus wentii DTO 134E9]